MASILDSGLASVFTGVFVFLLVYAIMWGALSRLKMFGEKNMGSYAIIALVTALLVAIAPPLRYFVTFVAPWFLAMAIVLFFILFVIGLFGMNADKDFPAIIRDKAVYTWIIIFSIIIVALGLAFTFGQASLEAGGSVPPGSTPPGNVIGSDGYQPPGTVGPGTATGVPQPGEPGSTATPSFQTNLINTLFHPKVLGLLIVFVLAALAVYFLSSPANT